MCMPDPLCWHGATRARVAHEYLLAAEAGLKAMNTYVFPFIVFHGADDTLTDPDGSKKLYELSQVTSAPIAWLCRNVTSLPSAKATAYLWLSALCSLHLLKVKPLPR